MEIHPVRALPRVGCASSLLQLVSSYALRVGSRRSLNDATDGNRCFGDKGDVEDITEGTYPFLASPSVHTINTCMQLLTASAADIISTVEFDQTGNYLATGDKGGRVVLFERNETVRLPNEPLGHPSS